MALDLRPLRWHIDWFLLSGQRSSEAIFAILVCGFTVLECHLSVHAAPFFPSTRLDSKLRILKFNVQRERGLAYIYIYMHLSLHIYAQRYICIYIYMYIYIYDHICKSEFIQRDAYIRGNEINTGFIFPYFQCSLFERTLFQCAKTASEAWVWCLNAIAICCTLNMQLFSCFCAGPIHPKTTAQLDATLPPCCLHGLDHQTIWKS